jgi:hypothetical protein
MVDYKEIPELIRAFLAASDDTGTRGWNDETAELAAAYITLVKEANERLRRCAEYLHRGMRSEAVHLAECQPRLLELAEALRLPDPVVWTRACMSHGLPPPPELLTDGLEEIEAAFAVERALEPLLARHRLLALAQSPVKNRQEVLRAVAAQDPKNPSWDEGLRMLDVARFKELRAEAKVAFRAHDRAGLERLVDELEKTPPRAPVPEDLKDGLAKALNSVRLETARKQLLPLLAQLDAARAAGDYDQATELLASWQETVDAAKVVLPADLQAKVRPTVVWVASESQRRGVGRKMQAIQPAIATGQRDIKNVQRNRNLMIGGIVGGGLLVLWGLLHLLLRH